MDDDDRAAAAGDYYAVHIINAIRARLGRPTDYDLTWLSYPYNTNVTKIKTGICILETATLWSTTL